MIVQRVDFYSLPENLFKLFPNIRHRECDNRKAALLARNVFVGHLTGLAVQGHLIFLLLLVKLQRFFFALWLKGLFSEDFHNRRACMAFGQFLVFFKGSLHDTQLPLHKCLIHEKRRVALVVIIVLAVRGTCVIANLIIFPHIDSAHSSPVNNALKVHVCKIFHRLADNPLKTQAVTDVHGLFL